MDNVYKRLAAKLDALPNGYPSTESGVELKILEKIFTPDEAEMALQIRPVPETVEMVAERLGKTVTEMQAVLDTMATKGQIGAFKFGGEQFYMFFPFVIGIYEFQLHRLDRELAELCEEYAPHLVKTFGFFKPAVARVVPVQAEVKGDLTVYRHEDVCGMLDEARSFQVSECICRKEKALEGQPCHHTREGCLSFSPEEKAFDKYPHGRVISREEALEVINRAEEEGLVHCTYNVQQGHVFICNCCSCCCGLLRGVKEFAAPYVLARSNFVAQIDVESCAACGDCAGGRCPMDAIVEGDGAYQVLAERCIGCGVCVSVCPTESISTVRRPEKEQNTPPEDLVQWYVERAAERGVELKVD